jgi:hypothetical protein
MYIYVGGGATYGIIPRQQNASIPSQQKCEGGNFIQSDEESNQMSKQRENQPERQQNHFIVGAIIGIFGLELNPTHMNDSYRNPKSHKHTIRSPRRKRRCHEPRGKSAQVFT